MDSLRLPSNTVHEVMAERLGVNSADVVHMKGEVEPGGEWVEWTCRRKVERGFTQDCFNEALRRDSE